MHILIFLVVLFAAIFFYLRQNSSIGITHSAGSESNENILNQLNPVYISDGKLFAKNHKDQIIQIESQYVQDMEAREERDKKLAGWKEGTAWDTSFTQMRGMGERHDERTISFSSATRLPSGKLLYFLKGAGFGGLFEYCATENRELRLMHSQALDYQDLSIANEDEEILLSAQQNGGIANIAVIDPSGKAYREVTGGDTMDKSPSWVPNRPNHIVYQSQGLARAEDGYVKGVGPAEIAMLDIRSGTLETVFADDSSDYLNPVVSHNGNLYFIRRPYNAEGYSQSNFVLDTLLFPFRLLRAVFHYLNFFSLMYSRKPLTSAGGPRVERDPKNLILQGRRIDAEKAMRKGIATSGIPSLVPADWVLIRCNENGQQETLAKSVAAYHLDRKGNIIYTNGCGIFYITPEGRHEKVVEDKPIEEIII